MTDPSYDLADILRSPLEPERDERPRSRGWGATLAAFVLAAAATAAVVLALGRGEGAEPVAAAPTTAAPTTVAAVESRPAFPAGYTPIDDLVAVRPEEPQREDDRLLVPFTMVVARDAVVGDVARPLGGVWELRTAGDAVLSRRIVFDARRPSVFAAEFPTVEGEIESLMLVERWEGRQVATAVEFPWPGLGNPLPTPVVIDLGEGASLSLTHIALGNFFGQVRWRLSGAPYGLTDIEIRLYRDDGTTVGEYVPVGSSLDPQPRQGFTNLTWARGIRAEQDDAATLKIAVDAWTGTEVRVDIPVPLP